MNHEEISKKLKTLLNIKDILEFKDIYDNTIKIQKFNYKNVDYYEIRKFVRNKPTKNSIIIGKDYLKNFINIFIRVKEFRNKINECYSESIDTLLSDENIRIQIEKFNKTITISKMKFKEHYYKPEYKISFLNNYNKTKKIKTTLINELN